MITRDCGSICMIEIQNTLQMSILLVIPAKELHENNVLIDYEALHLYKWFVICIFCMIFLWFYFKLPTLETYIFRYTLIIYLHISIYRQKQSLLRDIKTFKCFYIVTISEAFFFFVCENCGGKTPKVTDDDPYTCVHVRT